ncbi:MAG: terminase small subunit [Syntrophaceae bacterium]
MRKPSEAQKQKIHDDIFEKTQKSMQRAGFSRDKIAREMARIAFSDIETYLNVDKTGKVWAKCLDTLPKGATKAIKKIKEKRRILSTQDEDSHILEDTFEFELYDKLDALKYAAGVMGMDAPKKIELGGKANLECTHDAKGKLLDRITTLAERRRESKADSEPE